MERFERDFDFNMARFAINRLIRTDAIDRRVAAILEAVDAASFAVIGSIYSFPVPYLSSILHMYVFINKNVHIYL